MDPVYRAPMRSRLDDVDPALAVERALACGLCGVGGRLPRSPADLADALDLTAQAFDGRAAGRLRRFAEAPEGAFVWTRDRDGGHYVGRLTGGWRYDDTTAALAADLVHVRDCTWHAVGVAEVPAAVRHTFARGGRNFQRVHDDAVSAESTRAWPG